MLSKYWVARALSTLDFLLYTVVIFYRIYAFNVGCSLTVGRLASEVRSG